MTRSNRYDAIVIGAGHNGLVCAAYLARAGRRVLVLERRHCIGGATVTEEHVPGFHFSSCSYVVSLLRPWIIRELELTRHGFDVIPLEETFTPFPDGRYLLRTADPEETRRNIARLAPRDAEVYGEFGRRMAEIGRLVRPLIDEPAPDPAALGPRNLRRLAALARALGGAGEDWMADLARMMTMSAVDFLAQWFESEELIAPLSVSGIIGTFLGVRSPGTAYVLLHHYMGEIDGAFRAWGVPRGGTGQVAAAIAAAARAKGARIVTGAPVTRVLTRGDGSVRGVVVASGEEYEADVVVSACDPRRTFLEFLPPGLLEADVLRQVERIKFRGSSAKVNLALDDLPEFRCLPGRGRHLYGDITIAPSIDYLERAYDEAKYGAWSRRPFCDVLIPSLLDPTVAPPGRHVMSIFVQYAPYHLAEGPSAWMDQRDAFADAVIATLEDYMPGLTERIVGRQVVTPWDLEQVYGLTEGNIFHGELSLEQLGPLRPIPGLRPYQTPVEGYWMCGSGTHPGGGIMGAPGALCARRLLRERRL